MAVQELTVDVTLKKKQVEVPVAVDRPTSDASLGVVVGHGASGDLHGGNMAVWAKAIAEAGCICVRFTSTSSGVDQRAAVIKELLLNHRSELPGCADVQRWVLAGQSLGARAACQAAEDLPQLVVGCMFFSWPLHAPGKLDQLRDEPLLALKLPKLIVRGTKDTFSTQKPWDSVFPKVLAAKLHTIEGGDHSLKVSGKGGAEATQAALAQACEAVKGFLHELADGQVAQPPSAAEQQQEEQQEEDEQQQPEAKRKDAKAAAGSSGSKRQRK